MKKLLSVSLLVLLVFTLSTSVFADMAPPYVDDQAGILTHMEQSMLTTQAREASERLDCGVYIVVVYDYLDLCGDHYLPISDVLKDYYMEKGYGTGSGRDGVILMLSMSDRDYSLFTNGFGDTGLSDPAMDYLVDTFLRDFHDDSWYNGFEHYITCTEELLQMTLDGHPFDAYTPTKGERIFGIVVCIALSLLIAQLITVYFVRKMKSVALELDAEEFAGRLHLTEKNDRYINTTTTRVYDPPSSSRNSGGHSGGGGGGSSRSGKF